MIVVNFINIKRELDSKVLIRSKPSVVEKEVVGGASLRRRLELKEQVFVFLHLVQLSLEHRVWIHGLREYIGLALPQWVLFLEEHASDLLNLLLTLDLGRLCHREVLVRVIRLPSESRWDIISYIS